MRKRNKSKFLTGKEGMDAEHIKSIIIEKSPFNFKEKRNALCPHCAEKFNVGKELCDGLKMSNCPHCKKLVTFFNGDPE